jgi:hypothetical protein
MGFLKDPLIIFSLTIFLVILISTKFPIINDRALDGDVSLGLLTVLGIFLAFKKYSDELENKRQSQVIELISFFRKEVLLEASKLEAEMRINKQSAVRIPVIADSKDDLRNKNKVLYDKQVYALTQGDSFILAVATANVLEEFAARVLVLNAQDDLSLTILHDSFVKSCETLTSFLLHDKLESKDKNFNNSLRLYHFWKQ